MALRIFVAGGTGVLGRASVQVLVEAGHCVRATARGQEKTELIRRLGAEPVELDLYDAQAVRRAVEGCDAVLRLTTKIPPLAQIRNPAAWKENSRLRTESARILVDASIAGHIPAYVHESVAFVYAGDGAEWLTEDSRTDDAKSDILRATLAGEQEAARFTQAGGRGIVLRFAGFYGAETSSTQEMAKMARKRMLARFGPGTNYFSSIYVPDAARAVVAALGVPAGIYNVSDDVPVPYAEYLRSLSQSLGAPAPYRLPGFLGKWMLGSVWSYFSRSLRVSNARLKAASGWRPGVPSVHEGWPLIAAELANGRKHPA